MENLEIMKNMYFELKEISEKESTKLYRLANNLQKRNCNQIAINIIREEANKLHFNSRPEDLLNPFIIWIYAFKF